MNKYHQDSEYSLLNVESEIPRQENESEYHRAAYMFVLCGL